MPVCDCGKFVPPATQQATLPPPIASFSMPPPPQSLMSRSPWVNPPGSIPFQAMPVPPMPVPPIPVPPMPVPPIPVPPMPVSKGGARSRKIRRSQRGGSYQFGPSLTPGLINNYGQAVVGGTSLIPDCVAASKTDHLGYTGTKGLPGLSGGRRAQSGGRYGFVSADGAGASGPPSMGGLAPMSRIACESSSTTANPLNPQAGGANLGGANLAYYAPTAGYGNTASTWVGATGSPSLIQTPYEAKTMNQACLKTGGARSRKMKARARKTKARKTRARKQVGGRSCPKKCPKNPHGTAHQPNAMDTACRFCGCKY
jgi:hypothetical protein